MSQLYQEANDFFIEEEYNQALSCYDKLIAESTQEGSSTASTLLADYYYKRSLTHQKLNQLQLSSTDSCKCIEILEKENPTSKLLARSYFRMGLCEFKLKNFNAANEALLKAQQLGSLEKDLVSMLEACKEKLPKAPAVATSVQEVKPSYPTSSRKPKNWDALSKAAEKEEEQEDQGINAVFQKIYRNADEDTRRAMLKSFTESNGTALSTDWKDVSSKKYETSPPDGLEARHVSSCFLFQLTILVG
ncbi:Cochaperone protein [Massospora cicadina]|nr:Cochaperone protein [Massospora cicadina]